MCYVCVLNECMYWCVVWDYMHVVGVVCVMCILCRCVNVSMWVYTLNLKRR